MAFGVAVGLGGLSGSARATGGTPAELIGEGTVRGWEAINAWLVTASAYGSRVAALRAVGAGDEASPAIWSEYGGPADRPLTVSPAANLDDLMAAAGGPDDDGGPRPIDVTPTVPMPTFRADGEIAEWSRRLDSSTDVRRMLVAGLGLAVHPGSWW